MGIIEKRLESLGIILPQPAHPVANYSGTKRSGNLLFVSGRVSELKGAAGGSVSEQEAIKAARDTMIMLLAIIKNDIEALDLIESVVKMQGFINSSADFTSQPIVLDGASDLLIDIFGESGHHARTATGVSQLPFGATIQIDLVLQLKA